MFTHLITKQMLSQHGNVRLLLFIALCMNIFMTYGNGKARALHISYPGIRNNAERDYAYSPLTYTGIQGSFAVAYSVIQTHASDFVMLNYSSGSITNKYGNSMHVQSAGIQTYKFFHKKNDMNKGLQWGWSNNNEFNIREVDEIKNFNNRSDYFTSFGPALRYIQPFSFLNRQFNLQTFAHIQIIGFKLLSSYVTSLPPGFEEPSYSGFHAFLQSVDLFYPGDSWNVGIQPALHYELKSGNALTVSYRYDYLQLKGAHTVVKSRGTWYVGITTGL